MPEFSQDQTFAALYLATRPEIAIAELVRHIPEKSPLQYLNNYRLSQVVVQVSKVRDCRDPGLLGLTLEDLCHDTDLRATQDIGSTVFAEGSEGLLVPSATNLGDNLILFPIHFRADSHVRLIATRHPRLYPQGA